MKTMKTLKKISLILLMIMVSIPTFACDIDGDGIDDPTSVDMSTGSWVWSSYLSSTSSVVTKSGLGMAGSFPVAGKYFNSTQDVFGVVNANAFWSFVQPTTPVPSGSIYTLGFPYGRVDANYLGGRDYDGDGIDDATKFINRCNKLKRSCYSKRTRPNVLLNIVSGGVPFSNLGGTFSAGFFGSGLAPIMSADIDNDGDDDICWAKDNINKPKTFKLICKDVLSDSKIFSRKIGRLFSKVYSLEINGAGDFFFSYKKRNAFGDTKIFLYDTVGNKSVHFIPVQGDIVTGDYLGTGSEQIGIATGGTLTIFDPITQALAGSLPMPAGTPIDCSNTLNGPSEAKTYTSRNICKAKGC